MNVYAFSGAPGTVTEEASSSHTLGIGIKGKKGVFSAGGKTTINLGTGTKKEVPNYANSSVWNRVNYRNETLQCTNVGKTTKKYYRKPVELNELQSADYTRVPETKYKYCGSQQGNGDVTQTSKTKQAAFSTGVDVLGVSLSAQSGWSHGTTISFKFKASGYLCYTNKRGYLYSSGLDTQSQAS